MPLRCASSLGKEEEDHAFSRSSTMCGWKTASDATEARMLSSDASDATDDATDSAEGARRMPPPLLPALAPSATGSCALKAAPCMSTKTQSSPSNAAMMPARRREGMV